MDSGFKSWTDQFQNKSSSILGEKVKIIKILETRIKKTKFFR